MKCVRVRDKTSVLWDSSICLCHVRIVIDDGWLVFCLTGQSADDVCNQLRFIKLSYRTPIPEVNHINIFFTCFVAYFILLCIPIISCQCLYGPDNGGFIKICHIQLCQFGIVLTCGEVDPETRNVYQVLRLDSLIVFFCAICFVNICTYHGDGNTFVTVFWSPESQYCLTCFIFYITDLPSAFYYKKSSLSLNDSAVNGQ